MRRSGSLKSDAKTPDAASANNTASAGRSDEEKNGATEKFLKALKWNERNARGSFSLGHVWGFKALARQFG